MLKKIILLLIVFTISGAANKAQEVPDTVWTKFMWPFEVGSVLFSYDDSKLYVNSSGNHHFMVLDAMTGDSLEVVSAKGAIYDLSDDGNFLYCIYPTNVCNQIDPTDNSIIKTLNLDAVENVHGVYLRNLVLSEDQQYLYVVGSFSLWQPEPNTFALILKVNAQTMDVIEYKKYPLTDMFLECAISPDGKYLAAVLLDAVNTLRYSLILFDAHTLEQIKVIADVGDSGVNNILFSPDGNMLAGIFYGVIKFFDTENFTQLDEIEIIKKYFAYNFKFTRNSNNIIWLSNQSKDFFTIITQLEPPEEKYSYDVTSAELDISNNEKFIISAQNRDLRLLNAKWEPSAVEDKEVAEEITIIPNPASDYIEIPEAYGTIAIYSNLGIKVMEINNPNGRIDISRLPAGVYYISINGRFEKFVKI